MPTLAYKRILIKISGEALAGAAGTGLDFEILGNVSSVIKRCTDAGVQVAVVVGAGNIWRGLKNGVGKLDRANSDHMGMLGTAINAIAFADVLRQHGVDARVMTGVDMVQFAEPFSRDGAIRHLEAGRVVVFGCGTGNPFFSTDTAAVLRAVETDCDAALMAKNVDGVYDKDPNKFPDAVKFEKISYDEILSNHLGVIDLAAAALAYDSNLQLLLFGINDPENIYRAVTGEKIGTVVTR